MKQVNKRLAGTEEEYPLPNPNERRKIQPLYRERKKKKKRRGFQPGLYQKTREFLLKLSRIRHQHESFNLSSQPCSMTVLTQKHRGKVGEKPFNFYVEPVQLSKISVEFKETQPKNIVFLEREREREKPHIIQNSL